MDPASLDLSVFPLLKESDLFSCFKVAATIQALQPNAKMFRRIDYLLLCVLLLKIRKRFLEALQQSYPHVSLVRIVSHAYSTKPIIGGENGFPHGWQIKTHPLSCPKACGYEKKEGNWNKYILGGGEEESGQK